MVARLWRTRKFLRCALASDLERADEKPLPIARRRRCKPMPIMMQTADAAGLLEHEHVAWDPAVDPMSWCKPAIDTDRRAMSCWGFLDAKVSFA